MKNQFKQIKSRARLDRKNATIFVAVFAVIGGIVLLITHAAGTNTTTQTQSTALAVDATNPCGATTTPSAIKHVVWIWEENHTLSSVIGNSSAPYTTSLANKCGHATNMLDNVVPTLSSEPNYLAASSGSNCVTGLEATGTGCLTTDGDSTTTNSLSTNSIFQQVKAAGGTWRSYQEGMQSSCQLTSGNAQVSPYFYAAKHNPDVFFSNIRTDCNSWSLPFPSVVCSTTVGAGCGAIPSSSFINDVRNGTLPTYSIVTPNLNNDMHGTTALPANVPAGDNWLKTYMPEILNGPNYKNGDTLVVVLWDEGSAGSTIPNVVLAPSVPVGATFTQTINNIGFLHTTEHLLSLSYLGCATGIQPGTSTACPPGSTADFSSTFLLAGGSTGGDTTKPTTSISAPANNATVSGTVTVTAMASDNVGVTKVELYVDGVLQPTADTTSPYSFSLDTTKFSAGNHSLTTKAYDVAGNIGSSAAVTVNVQLPAAIPGDINNDGKVDLSDVSLLASHWKTSDSASDLNKDGIVDLSDLSIVISHYTG